MPVLTDPLGWFTLQVPDGWTSATDDCVTTLRGPEGVGIVYVSGGRHVGGRQEGFGGVDFLRRFLAHLGITVEPGSIRDSQGVGCRIYSYDRQGPETHWSFWSVTDEETALLISYTCAVSDQAKEAAAVHDIVRSVRLYHSTPVH